MRCTTAMTQYVSFFRAPANSGTLPADDHSAANFELANMEWWNILNGRPQLTPSASPTTISPTVSGSSFPGRWGENVSRLDPNVLQVLAGTTVLAGVGTPGGDPWPLPGTSGFDDNNNAPESGQWPDTEMGITYPAFVHPLDYFAAGFWVSNTEGKTRQFAPVALAAQQRFPTYSNYFTNTHPPLSVPGVQWATPFAGALMPGSAQQALVDEPDETWTEPALAASQSSDVIYGPQENMLQLSGPDSTLLGNPTRSTNLATFNLVKSDRAAQIRQRLASTSWDLKSFGKEFLGVYSGTNDARRLWEFTDTSPGATGVGPFRFPPDVAVASLTPPITSSTRTLYPLRLDLAHLLWTLADPQQKQTSNAQILPQRPMSINHLVEQVPMTDPTTGNQYTGFRFRPLTPHPTAVGSPPTTLLSTPIPVPPHSSDGVGYTISTPEQLHAAGGTAQQQEWLARYDRQRLARDIYTLLYLTGGGNDAVNYATTPNQPAGGTGPRPLYTEDQLREMAQFAVNLVDALDPDTNITVFEYDKDLSNGWNLDDNAYDNGAGDTVAPFSINLPDRGVVYGVERQQLAFNEAQVIFADCINPVGGGFVDHPDTQYDESQGYWSFFFAELENVSPFPVSFVNEGWQIAIKESPTVIPSTFYGQEMRMIVGAGQPNVQTGPNARFTIGTAGATQTGASYVANMNNALDPARSLSELVRGRSQRRRSDVQHHSVQYEARLPDFAAGRVYGTNYDQPERTRPRHDPAAGQLLRDADHHGGWNCVRRTGDHGHPNDARRHSVRAVCELVWHYADHVDHGADRVAAPRRPQPTSARTAESYESCAEPGTRAGQSLDRRRLHGCSGRPIVARSGKQLPADSSATRPGGSRFVYGRKHRANATPV